MKNGDPVYKRLQITAIIPETNDTKSFELSALDDWAANYEAGQFITFVFRKGDKEDRRSYSFSSSPVLNEPMRITVKRIANGEYSRQLFNHAKPGNILISSGIAGYFRLPEEYVTTRQLFFLAAGSGITPIFSILKTALHTTSLPVVLVYSNHSEKDTIFYKDLLQLQQQFKERLSIEFLFSHIRHVYKSRLSKSLLNVLLEKYKIPLQQTLFYICGPAGYMLMAGISLITAGVPEENIKKESFNTRKHIIKPVPPDTAIHNVKVSINHSIYEFPVQYPDTILSAAKKLNIHLPYSCEAGNCGSCSATCTKGKIWMAYNEVLMDDEIEKGKVLTCQGYPVGGDAVIEF
ncbi:MAG: ferredoxin--NADP reductase [Bacteroidota bacterium]